MRLDSIVGERTRRRASNFCWLMLFCGITAGTAALATAASCSDTDRSQAECLNHTGIAGAIGFAGSLGIFCACKVVDKLCDRIQIDHHVDGFTDLIETEEFTYNV